ncbi:orotate phosphoribosyltransferase [Plesiocystis pacifica SIR-1]|uniref:Orotate phosphoribosyltransferase n=1 Tax=Plesiocystis pacifica SIR-1 TaxID=391625 RepID=A6G356_9BACT|nr:orotate phosphoribosyltransferase [Plesiocystis pacifica]EDM79681.1 orotate phosphoribosyltransferase [Plesiocystis pacifica SIR-1]
MQAHQAAFVDLLVRYEVIRFGEFTLKSGRKSPYFVNAGQLRTGQAIAGLGRAYAAEIQRARLACDLVFGPAYKGVPLAVATAIGLAERGLDVPYGFDRKEAKDHGEGGIFVGTKPEAGMKVVLVDDVITSGRSIREAVELLREAAPDVQVTAAIVAVDRCERGRSEKTTMSELREELGVDVRAIVDIREVVAYLHGRQIDGRVVLDDAGKAAIEAYLAEYAGQA